MRRIVYTFLLLLCVALQGQAVLKEKSLTRTLGVLRLEMASSHARQKKIMAMYEKQSQAQHAELVEYMQQSEQISLILYSQNSDFTFDMAYACQEATDLYRKMKQKTVPYDKIRNRIKSEIVRYDSLIYALEQLPPAVGEAKTNMTHEDSLMMKLDDAKLDLFTLSEAEQNNRKQCLTMAKKLRDNLELFLKTLDKDNKYYANVRNRVENLNDYAKHKYAELQQSIFINGGTSYFKLLITLPMQIERMKNDYEQKYKPLGVRNYSEWRGPVVLFCSVFMLFYIFVAALISNALLRWILPRFLPQKYQTENIKKKRPIFIMALAIFIFAVVVMLLRAFAIKHNLMIMASGMMIKVAWLMEAIYVSMLIRLNGNQIKYGAKIYDPFILMSLIVVWLRIVLIPNSLVNVFLPPILLGMTLWQLSVIRNIKKNVPLSDKVNCSISLVVMLASCVMAWVGFTLMGVQLLVWWMFQLAAIATITCVYDMMEMYEIRVLEKKIKNAYSNEVTDGEILSRMRKGEFVTTTWFYDFVNRAFVPICAVASVFFSVFMAAEIFEIRDLCVSWFVKDLINEEYLQVSLFKLMGLGAGFFLFKYIEYLLRSAYFRFRKSSADESFNATLAKNVIAIVVWGIYIISTMILLKVPRSGIEYVATGLVAGLGFASKDLLENFIYGLSLMTGRVRVGDYIECDGITGKVESISYLSTQIVTLDGSVIAFLNSQLFSKNFKNLTRNHEYELVKVPFGVAYGVNVDEVRKMVLDGISEICVQTEDGRDIVNPKNPINVAFSNFGDNSVDLLLVFWVLVDQKISFTGKAKEKIYKILNENNIEIPFPQQDVYIRSIAKME